MKKTKKSEPDTEPVMPEFHGYGVVRDPDHMGWVPVRVRIQDNQIVGWDRLSIRSGRPETVPLIQHAYIYASEALMDEGEKVDGGKR